MKKTRYLSILILLCLLSACGISTNEEDVQENNALEAEGSALEHEDKQATIDAEAEESEENDTAVVPKPGAEIIAEIEDSLIPFRILEKQAASALYENISERSKRPMYQAYLNELIYKIDSYSISEYGMGLYRVDLVDFDHDGIDEMVCFFSVTETEAFALNFPFVEIYQYKDGHANLVFQMQAGLGNDNVPFAWYYFRDDQLYVCVGKNEFYEPEIHFCTIINGEVIEDVYMAEKYRYTDPVYGYDTYDYINCYINHEAVDGNYFAEELDAFYQNGYGYFRYQCDFESGNFFDNLGMYTLENLRDTIFEIENNVLEEVED